MEEKWNEMREISDDNEHDKVRQINDEKKKLCDEWKTEKICLSNNKRYYISGVKTLKSALFYCCRGTDKQALKY